MDENKTREIGDKYLNFQQRKLITR